MFKSNHTLFCFRCYHIWNKRKQPPPKTCPLCRSPYWNKPRKKISRELVLHLQEMIIHLHNAIIRISGGETGLRDEGGIYHSTYKLLNHQINLKNHM